MPEKLFRRVAEMAADMQKEINELGFGPDQANLVLERDRLRAELADLRERNRTLQRLLDRLAHNISLMSKTQELMAADLERARRWSRKWRDLARQYYDLYQEAFNDR